MRSYRRALAGLFACITALVFTGVAAASATGVVVSEFRFRGPNGGSDEFVELLNTAAQPVSVGGWRLDACNSTGSVSTRATIPAGTTLPPGGRYLLANGSTSGGPYSGAAFADLLYFTGVGDEGGVRLVMPGGAVEDRVGTTHSAAASCREGAGLSQLTTNLDRSYERKAGGTQDTDVNATDFALRSPSDPQNAGPLPTSPIGAVQGSVPDSADGTTHAGPLSNRRVVVQGVVYQRTLARAADGSSQHGFFVQNTALTADADPNSSDGVFVFTGASPAIGGGYLPQPGDEIRIEARPTEFFNLTQLTGATLLELVRFGVALDLEVPALELDPPDVLAAANRYWERAEGARVTVPAGSVVLGGRSVFPSTADGEVWVARPDEAIALRDDPYSRRSFRDPHPLDNVPDQLFDDGNGYRILLASLGIKATEGESSALIAPARTFDTVSNATTGGVYFAFSKYSVQITQQPVLAPGAEPAGNAPPQAFDRGREYSVADYNVENLYDFRDDPSDGCDFATNAGCFGQPGTADDVRPPFDYVPASAEVYEARLGDIAEQIVGDLHAPDLLLAQEAEDQDMCTVVAGALRCDAGDADGRPDTLQELALAIEAAGGPVYVPVYDRDGADVRGIVSAFLYRADRVELRPFAADDPVFGATPEVDYPGTPLASNADAQNPKALNAVLPAGVDTSTGTDGTNVYTRAPQVGSFRIWRDGIGTSVFTDVYALSNHFSSTPDRRVGQRREQSRYNAALVEALGGNGERILTGGDFNVFPRPDDPFNPGHAQFPSDQLGPLYDAGLVNLFDVVLEEAPASAYSYVFVGQAQTLDHQFVTPALHGELTQARVAHVNADYAADHPGDGPRGLSDHDPMVSRYDAGPTLARLVALVEHYAATGGIVRPATERLLLDRLERARRFAEAGQDDPYRSQLEAFATQALDQAPDHMGQVQADALAREARLLATLGA